MKKLLSALLLTSCIFSQDVLTTISGKTYKGEYGGDLDDRKVIFKMESIEVPSIIYKNTIKQIKLENGEILVFFFTMKMKEGKEINGSWLMTSLDYVKFIQMSDGKTLNIEISDIDYIKRRDGTFIDLMLVTNPEQLEEGEKRYVAEKLLEQCEENKEVKVLVMPIKDDLYGLTEMIEENHDSLCYTIIENELGLKYFHKENISSEDMNDYYLQEAGKSVGANIVIYGYAYDFTIPFKYSSTTSDALSVGELWQNKDNDVWTDLFNALGKVMVVKGQQDVRYQAITEAGTYVNLTYFSLNLKTGEKIFIAKNMTVLKIG